MAASNWQCWMAIAFPLASSTPYNKTVTDGKVGGEGYESKKIGIKVGDQIEK